jgi:RNA polymerase sigma-70 factor (family 1)
MLYFLNLMERLLDIKPLLLRVSEGDENAFNVLFRAYYQRINSFATRLTRSEIIGQETVQEVFIKIWLKRSTLKSIDNFDAYLFAIVRNHVYNVLRRQALEIQARTMLQSELTIASSSGEEDPLSEKKQLLRRVIDGLPLQQRRVLHLCRVQGLKYQEAAALLNISQLTVKTHLQQALRNIRLQLGRLILSLLCGSLDIFL